MKIRKIFNNNAVLATDNNGHEVVLLGKGIAFSKKIGDSVNAIQIQKKYVFEKEPLTKEQQMILNEISPTYIELAETIQAMGELKMGIKLNKQGLLGLIDHISFAIQRYQENKKLKNILLWDIKKFYPKEFQVGLMALDLIYYDTNIMMDEDEAAFIAMHFINAQEEHETMRQSEEIEQMVTDILHIVEQYFQIHLDQSSVAVLRFVTHIRFFARRLFLSEMETAASDETQLFIVLKRQYPETYKCTKKIASYLKKQHKVKLTLAEWNYFMLHIQNVRQRVRGQLG